jgi:hypothetical protein
MKQIQVQQVVQQTWLNLKSLPWDKSVGYALSIGVPLAIGSSSLKLFADRLIQIRYFSDSIKR